MSFENLKKPELVKIAESFGTRSTGTKAEIVEDLAAEGVTWELYESLAVTEKPEESAPVEAVEEPKKEEASGDDVVLKFLGSGRLQTSGVKVSGDNPFAVVAATTADRLLKKYPETFREASVRELETFYA